MKVKDEERRRIFPFVITEQELINHGVLKERKFKKCGKWLLAPEAPGEAAVSRGKTTGLMA